MKEMQKLVSHVDFIAANIEDTQFDKINQQLLQADDNAFPWASEREGWRRMTITIGVPSGKKSTQASRREAAAAQCCINQHEEPEDSPLAHAIRGYHYSIPFHHKSMCTEIRTTLLTDPAACDFVMDPYLVEHAVPNTACVERAYGKVNSEAFVREDLQLQNSLPEPGCNLLCSVLAIMLWSERSFHSSAKERCSQDTCTLVTSPNTCAHG